MLDLADSGLTKSEIARRVGLPRSTVRDWLLHGRPGAHAPRAAGGCVVCRGTPSELPAVTYSYLLGLYLGDGHISPGPRGVYRLRITCADAHPFLMDECERAMAEIISPNRVGRMKRKDAACTDVYSYSKHWACLLPQHGPGPKHHRPIALTDWQESIVDPRALIRGLIHSDGCRSLNRAYGTDYPPYPRYIFSNASDDIRGIFARACDAIGVEWRLAKPRDISIAKRASVALLDEFVGPKW